MQSTTLWTPSSFQLVTEADELSFGEGTLTISKERLTSKILGVATFFYKTKCKCRLQTIGPTVLKSLGDHNHLAEPENAEKQKAYAELKKRATICNSQPPGSLIATFSMEPQKHVLAKFPSNEHTKKTVYNQTGKELPHVPNDFKSLHIPNELQIIKFGEHELPMVAAETGAENGNRRIIASSFKHT